MWFRRAAGTLLLAISASACGDQQPLSPDLSGNAENAVSFSNQRRVDLGVERAGLLTEIPIMAEQDGQLVEAFLSITELDATESDGEIQLFADGIVSYVTEDGEYLAEAFEDEPITLSRSAGGSTASNFNAALLPSGEASFQRGPAESGVCDILYLTLGPLFLDVLGLTVDLSVIELDLDAVAGAGNLLGNLLCAVTGLLDGVGTLLQILQFLGQINDILDAIDDLLSGLPVLGSVLSGETAASAAALSVSPGGRTDEGEFTGTFTVTGISWDDTGETLLVDGILSGKTRVDGRIRQIRNVAVSGVPATLGSEPSNSSGAAFSMSGIALQQGPDEPGICDVLYLDLAPTFLDLLGLTVDLAEVELDVDAVPGSGRLLGNLLCGVTGLLDGVGGGGGLGGLLEGLLQGLLDAISQLLGGLSL